MALWHGVETQNGQGGPMNILCFHKMAHWHFVETQKDQVDFYGTTILPIYSLTQWKQEGVTLANFFPDPFEFQLSISNQTTISQTWKLWKMRNSQHFFNRSNLTKVANVVAITFAFPVLREIPQTIDHSNPCSSHRTHPAPPSLFFAALTLPQQRRMSVGIIVAHGLPLEV